MSTLRLMAIDAICQRGSVREADVATLRRAFALEPQISASDIDGLFRAHTLARVQHPAWSDFFVELMTDYVVRELEPAGYVTSPQAGWLIARVSSAGRIRTRTELDLILNVIDKARWVPESLVAFALGQIRDAVRLGEGPLRAGGEVEPGAIALAEVEQIRALLFAYGTEGPSAITQVEAEAILDIDAALAPMIKADAEALTAAQSPLDGWPIEAWQDLAQKAIVNAVLAASGYAGPTREEALNEIGIIGTGRPQSHLADNQDDDEAGLLSTYRPLPLEARALQRLELQRIEIITGEAAAPADPARLAGLLMRNELSPGSSLGGLLDRLRHAGFALHPAFAACGVFGAVNAA